MNKKSLVHANDEAEGLMGGSVRPLKRFGQHFLRDTSIARRMVKAAQICPGDHVLEIGSGQGILTRAILESQAKLVTAVEVDRRLFAELEKSFDQDDRVRLVFGDILKIDLDEVAGKDTKLRIMGNLPYCITSPILFHILDRRDAVCDAVVTVQKEVASRLTAAPHSKAYGIPTVLFRVFGQVDALFDIPRTAFFPVPAVESSVIRIKFDESPSFDLKDEALFRKILKEAFQQRRKMLRNTLKPYARDIAAGRLSGILSCRPEEIDVETWVALSNQIAGFR